MFNNDKFSPVRQVTLNPPKKKPSMTAIIIDNNNKVYKSEKLWRSPERYQQCEIRCQSPRQLYQFIQESHVRSILENGKIYIMLNIHLISMSSRSIKGNAHKRFN